MDPKIGTITAGIKTGAILVDIKIGTIIRMVIATLVLRHFLDPEQIEGDTLFKTLAGEGGTAHGDRITIGKNHHILLINKTCETITTESVADAVDKIFIETVGDEEMHIISKITALTEVLRTDSIMLLGIITRNRLLFA